MQQKISYLKVLRPQDTLEKFFKFLDRPQWFMEHFIPAFNRYFKNLGKYGYILTVEEDSKIRGTVLVDERPQFYYKNEPIPIFGWLKSEDAEITEILLAEAKLRLKSKGFSMIRGPINHPKLFGGWGMITEGFKSRPLINCAWNDESLPKMIKKGWEPTTYYNQEFTNFNDYTEYEREIEIISPKITEMKKNQALLHKLESFVQENFNFLPDTSDVSNQFKKFLDILDQFENGHEFYQIGIIKDANGVNKSNEIASFSVHIPNLFDHWQGNHITSTNWDVLILNRKYRGSDAHDYSHHFWQNHRDVMRDRGIEEMTGTYIWERNKILLKKMKSFSKTRNIIKIFNVEC